MTDEEALQKIVEKAVKNGFVMGNKRCFEVITRDGKLKARGFSSYKLLQAVPPYYLMVIYRPDFARAFWGEYWRPRLQTQVLEDNPIQYMVRYL